MCNYSIEAVSRRDAQSDELLITTQLGEHGSIGLASPKEPNTAVCLVPGMRVRINVSPAMARDFGVSAGPAMATFTQRDLPGDSVGYRDGFVFDESPDEQHLLQDFDLRVAIIPIAADTLIAEQEQELVDA